MFSRASRAASRPAQIDPGLPRFHLPVSRALADAPYSGPNYSEGAEMVGKFLILGCFAAVLSGCVSTGSGRGSSSNYDSRHDGYSRGYNHRESYDRRDYHDDDRRSEREKKCNCRVKPFKAMKRAFGL